MRDIHKRFGKVRALSGVDFAVGHNEIVGLVGDNGAGKSTLIKILSGIQVADKGEIYCEGRKVNISSPKDAMTLGIETVYQEQALVPEMSIPRNIFMGREPVGPVGLLNKKLMVEKSVEILKDIGLDMRSPNMAVKNLSGGERQGVAIARAMHFRARLLILDEPTMALSVKESQQVLQFVSRLKHQGTSCIFITHNFYHAYPIADRFVVLSRGKKVGDSRKEDTSIDKLVELVTSG
jgi:simple sugar transport system ATP-binding protein